MNRMESTRPVLRKGSLTVSQVRLNDPKEAVDGCCSGSQGDGPAGRSEPGINSLDTTEQLRPRVDLTGRLDIIIPGLPSTSRPRPRIDYIICRTWQTRYAALVWARLHCQADEVAGIKAIAVRTGRITEAVVLIRYLTMSER